jgi:CRISPR-associated exonuclease Cas4
MLIAAVVCFFLALILLRYALRLREKTGIPWVRVVGSDTGGGKPLQQPLFSPDYGLTGKPDYIIQVGQHRVPVEVKPGRTAPQPYESDMMQVVVYCLLLEATTAHPPPYGLLRYAESSFRIPYTPEVRSRLLDVLDAMQADLDADDCARCHNNPNRCRRCGFADVCEESLVA